MPDGEAEAQEGTDPEADGYVPPELRTLSWGPARSFLGLSPPESRWEGSRHVVLPVPYEATTSWGAGTGQGPDAILEASAHLETYDHELDAEPHARGICTLPPLELTDEGPEAAVRQLRAAYDALLEATGDRFVVALGGEHSISSAPIHAWQERLDGELSVLQLDAHTDLRPEYAGTPWSHASVMRRAMEATDRIVAVGVRSMTAGERELVRRGRPEVIFAEELRGDGRVPERAVEPLSEHVYVTFDVDFFDPSLMPATGTPEPGGGTWWDALDVLREVFRRRTVVGADVVELAPRRGEEASALTAAKIAYKMMGYRTGLG